MTLPVALSGTDVIGQAKTGTGKTLGFGLPLLERVTVPADVEAGRAAPEALTNAPQALVVVPTRELCTQVTNDLLTAGKVRNVRVLAIYGGRAYEPQVEALKKGVDVVVGTPGRLLDLAGQRKLDLKHIKSLVLDEADEMLDLGFLPDVEKIIAMLPAKRQTMLFSATMPGAVIGLARRYMSQPTHIRATAPDDEGATVANIAQFVYRAHSMDKPEMIARILQADGRGLAMIFCRTKRTAADMAATLAAGLAEHGWVVVSGGAYGVDGAAHRGALGAGGATVAVLACGVDRPYPRGHTELIGRIAEQGLVVGELPPGEHPTQSRFVLRNRVIAALTRGTVVVEAAHRSGSLVTARAAQRLGRFTMGVPGPATSGLSAGVHELLRGEAVLVTDAAEVVELVGDMGALAPARRGPVLPRDLLESAARRVLAALPGNRSAAPEEVARGAQTSEDEAVARLYELRALGYVERHGDGWKLTRQAMISVRDGRSRC
ncbi:DNA-processing protein DprA [Streptomyces sp. NPDC005921]